MVSTVLARWALLLRFRASATSLHDPERWGRRFALGAATTGVLWGVAGFFLLEQADSVTQLLVSFVIGGMCAAAAGTTACYLPAFEAYCLPALSGLAFRMLLFTDVAHRAMAGLVAVYAVAMSLVARNNNRALTEAFALRFENEKLVRQLSVTHAELAETNRTLEHKIAERTEELQQQGEALRDAQRMEAVGRLAGGVAHDFNNLLTVILANVSAIAQQFRSENYVGTLLEEVRSAATRGADLVRQLLLFSRRQPSTPLTLDVNHVAREMLPLLQHMVGERLELHLKLHNAPLWVRLDPTQLEQMVINLVANARDATPDSGSVTIEIGMAEYANATDGVEPGQYAVLAVTDTGTGMDSETRKLIFDPFFTTKEVGKGTGLGLASVYGIVKQGGGAIRVTSDVDCGSTFRVFLPLTDQANSDVGSNPLAVTPASEPPLAPNATTVLLVEDEPTVRRVTQRILKRAGFRVLTAEGAEQAFAIAAAYGGTIELLITDVMMAKVGGPELAQQLRASRPDVRTLYISGYSREKGVLQQDLTSGAAFLGKPFTDEILVAKVKELLAAAPGLGPGISQPGAGVPQI